MKKDWNPNAREADPRANVKSMSVHRGFAVVYGIIAAFIVFMATQETSGHLLPTLGLAAGFLFIGCLHGAVAFGAARRNSTARAASIAIACLMLFAFPIGSLIGLYLLWNRNWVLEA